MKIEHLAVWTRDIEVLRLFYEKYFGAEAGRRYVNPATGFSSYFLTFDGGARLEVMQMESVRESAHEPAGHYLGMAHLAISVGSKASVDRITELLRKDGFAVLSAPRVSGDGYYESVILDPAGNRVEITS